MMRYLSSSVRTRLLASVAAFFCIFASSAYAEEYLDYKMIEVLCERGTLAHENIEAESGTIVHTPIGTVMTAKAKNNAWTYFFELDPAKRHCLHWTADLEVLGITGTHWAGVTLELASAGVAFRVNRMGRGELAFFKDNIGSYPIRTFRLPPEAAKRVRAEFTLTLDYDVRTKVLTCRVDEIEALKVTLPYMGMPAFATAVGASMETTTGPKLRRNETVFGSLILRGGR